LQVSGLSGSFSGRNPISKHAVQMHNAGVDALFQLKLEEFSAIWRDYGKR